MTDKRSLGMATPEEYNIIMRDIETRTIPFEFGFIGADPTGKRVTPVFVVEDKHFPKGQPMTDICTWNYNCNAISRHVIFDFKFENDRTHDKTAFAINLCPFELLSNKILNKQMEVYANMVTKNNQHVDTCTMGREMRDIMTQKKSMSSSYDRLGAHVGQMDITSLVLTLIFLKLSFLPNVMAYERSQYCFQCRRHNKKK